MCDPIDLLRSMFFDYLFSINVCVILHSTFLSRLVTLCSDYMSSFGDFFKQFLIETWLWENFMDGSIVPSPHFSFKRLTISNVPLIGMSGHNLMHLCTSESRFCLTHLMSKLAIVKSHDT